MIRLTSQLRILREHRNLTQEQLAELALIGKRTLQKAEKGEPSSMETVLSIAGALDVHPNEILDDTCVDALSKGPFDFHRYVDSVARPEELAYCRDVADAENAVDRMRESWIAHIEREGVVSGEFRRGYDRLISLDFDDYKSRYVRIQQRHETCMLFAAKQDRRMGISVILPVSETTYSDFVNGEVSFLEITDHQVIDQSNHLLIDSCVEFSDTMMVDSDALQFTVFYQLAALSEDAGSDEFRIASFGASPLNTERLIANGFRPIESKMPTFGYPLFEFSAPEATKCDLPQETFAHYVKLYQKREQSDGEFRFRQHAMKRYLRAYQQLLKRYPRIDADLDIA